MFVKNENIKQVGNYNERQRSELWNMFKLGS